MPMAQNPGANEVLEAPEASSRCSIKSHVTKEGTIKVKVEKEANCDEGIDGVEINVSQIREDSPPLCSMTEAPNGEGDAVHKLYSGDSTPEPALEEAVPKVKAEAEADGDRDQGMDDTETDVTRVLKGRCIATTRPRSRRTD